MGPLQGIKVIELAGLGPAPCAGMMLADMGAEVILIERRNAAMGVAEKDVSRRGKYSLVLDLKSAEGREAVLRLLSDADVLLEGYRPGVMERLGLGPDECLARNPRLIYARMTGWGQSGPLAETAGHDINYIALTGALAAIGRKDDKPVIPLNLVGDFAGGAMFVLTGILAALLERSRSGQGQVIDAAMTDGTISLMGFFLSWMEQGLWQNQRGVNMLDGSAHFYDCYETADGRYVSIGAIEPQFYQLLLEKLGLESDEYKGQMDAANWPEYKEKLAAVFRQRTQLEWCQLLEGTDACFAPVLDMQEAQYHPHNRSRQTHLDIDGMVQPAPAPRFSRTASVIGFGPRPVGADTAAVLARAGFSEQEIAALSQA